MEYYTLVDTLSVSFPVDPILSKFSDQDDCLAVETYLKCFVEGITGHEFSISCPVLNRKKNFFNHSANFDGGFIAWGGNNTAINKAGVMTTRPEKIQIYFDSAGCYHLSTVVEGEVSGLEILRDRLLELEGKITRCDIAADFYNGELTIDEIEQAYKADKFTKTMRPKAKRISDIDQQTDGDTLYIGNRANGKMLRAYEKGKQLGTIDSQWVRVELELLAKDRDISPYILTDTASAFAQSYPYLKELCETYEIKHQTWSAVVQNTKRKTASSIEHQFRHAQRSYGKLITLASETFDSYGLDSDANARLIVGLLHREVGQGLPRSLQHLPKNHLRDCVTLHTLYSAEFSNHAAHRMS